MRSINNVMISNDINQSTAGLAYSSDYFVIIEQKLPDALWQQNRPAQRAYLQTAYLGLS